MSPILTGYIMDSFLNKYEGYKWGIRLIFWWSIFAMLFMIFAWIRAYSKFSDKYEIDVNEEVDNEDMNQTMADLVF